MSTEHGEELWELQSEECWEGWQAVLWYCVAHIKKFVFYTCKDIGELRIGRDIYLHIKRILSSLFPLPMSLFFPSLHLPDLNQNLGKTENLLHF